LKAILTAGLLRDADAQVRLAAFLALADMPPSSDAAVAVVEALEAGAADRDTWLPDAVTIALAAHDEAFLGSVARITHPGSTIVQVVRRVADHYARGGPAGSVGKLLVALPGAELPVAGAVVAGLAAGWPKDRTAALDREAEAALVALLPKLPAESRASLVSLAARWGNDALERQSVELAATLAATLQDPSRSDESRAEAARQLIEFRPRDPETVRQLLAQITPRTAPQLASALVAAAGRSDSPRVGPALVAALPNLSPRARDEALRALVARADRTAALLDGVEQGTIALSALSLDQRQALAAHPNASLAARAKALLERGGGLPDPDRQKVIDAIATVALQGGDLSRGRDIFKQQCAKCHTHSGEGGKVGPDLTGMAVHPRDELLVHILDPSRSVEGNFFQYAIATTDGRVLNGLLASETKTTVDLVDTEGKTLTIQRSEIDEMVGSRKSVMPEGFEKQIPPEGFADLLAFLTRPGKYLPLDLRPVATVVSTRGMFFRPESPIERIVFPDWSPKTFEGIPFHLVDPQGDRVPNMILLYGPNGQVPPRMPHSVSLPCHTAAKAIHLLSGISGWGAGGDGVPPTVSMIVRLHYANGATEDHPLENGVHFADYIRRVDVPGSKLAFLLRGRQVRYLAVRPKRSETIDRIELVKGPDDTAPIVVAATVEVAD
jgi:putative heme-binding domain-containing protein